MTWRHYKIGTNAADVVTIYAPSLQWAFHLARLHRFGSRTITCYGSPS